MRNRLSVIGMVILTLPTSLFVFSNATLAAESLEQAGVVAFDCLVLSDDFYSEGAAFADFNQDGHNDVVSGPFWYAGPDFAQPHRYMAGERLSIKAYSKHFFSFTHDLNADGFPDVLVVGMPGEPARWYENPGVIGKLWTDHHVLDDCGNESPVFTDLTGDGLPELVCVHGGAFGYAEPNWEQPNSSWRFRRISANRALGRFTHGLGVGDVDSDGKRDLLETTGWHQNTSKRQSGAEHTFSLRPQKFAEAGGAQMFAYDFDGDGDQDVVSVQNAHAWGLTWFERRGSADDFLWVPHSILTDKSTDNEWQLSISQMHSLALADIDGDGVKDLVTGKRFYAHGGADPGASQLPVLYWFRTTRLPGGGVRFVPHLIHPRVGVGTQLTTGDLNGDNRVDIVVGNKLGTFVLLNRAEPHSPPRSNAVSLVGTPDFSLGVRNVDPKSPEDERRTFVLPEGFDVQLFASEPDIAKPLNMAFDAKGRMWVTNTLEYPYPVPVGEPGRDSIKILEDANHDGKADSITTFADGLNIPMGLYPYKDGVVCFSIPNIWFLRDTDNDGKCDKREILYGPFDHTRDTHGMCNAFTRGYDGWLYACHGFNNQSSVRGADGNRVTMHSGNTFRLKLDGSRIEHFTHGQVNPFGMSYDARGDLLTADCHTKPVTLLLQGGYYESFGKPHDGLGFVPSVMEHLHGSTAIGGIAVTPSTWPTAFQNNALGGNVMTSRVNRNSLIYDGSSVRAQEESDFLIAGDSWFRPVDLKFGPDGALYIADFYNRIIGHYEVPLVHPGRDRKSGRIWRVTYTGSSNQRGLAAAAEKTVDLKASLDEPRQLVETFQSPIPAKRMLAADHLVDRWGKRSIDAVLPGLQHELPQVRLHCLWVLARLDATTERQLDAAIRDASPLVRAHTLRVVGDLGHTHDSSTVRYLIRGLADSSPLVCRAAATACLSVQHSELAMALIDCVDRSDVEDDVHLLHAIRIAVKHQLENEDVFSRVEKKTSTEHVTFLGQICLALPREQAARFIVEHLHALSREDGSRINDYIRHAARYVPADSISKVVHAIRSRGVTDTQQLELLKSIGDGLRQRSLAAPAVVQEWAIEVATNLMDFDKSAAPIAWQAIPHPEHDGDQENTWTVSTKRDSSDGRKATRLWSSFPQGEQRTGIYRSSNFTLTGETFGFYFAGHDGFPNQELQGRNRVQVRDGRTHEVLQTWSAPRQDTAVPCEWIPPAASRGREVYVELTDGDPSNAFAWIAVGRFTDSRLNPSDLLNNRKIGCELVNEFSLTRLRPHLAKLIQTLSTDRQTRQLVAHTLAMLEPRGVRLAVAESLKLGRLSQSLVDQASRMVAADTIRPEEATQFMASSLKFASSVDCRTVGQHLAADEEGAEVLLELIELGHMNASCLNLPSIQTKLEAIASSTQKDRIETLKRSIVDEGESVVKAIQGRKVDFLVGNGRMERGKLLFGKQCATCHQVAGQGQQVGPNLDGIGNRGLDRLVEDVLAPNRNVDVAFRATTIVTSDGRAITGLVRGVNGAVLSIVDTKAQLIRLPVALIEEQSVSLLSPMPANFHDVLTKREFADLMTYLLSLTH